MMRIDGCAPGACGATGPSRAGRAVNREAGGGLASELCARIVLGHQLDVAVRQGGVGRLVFDSHVRQLDMPIDDEQVMRSGERGNVFPILRTRGSVEKG